MTIENYDEAAASGLRPAEAARQLVATLTPDEKLRCLDGDAPTWAGLGFLADDGYHRMAFHGAQLERVGFPGIAFSDGPRGAVVGNATCFPVSMARGATWDPDLEERVGDAIGRELRATGADLTGAVCVNVLRHPAWGRAQETYGEDPFHVGEMGAAFTRGLQRHVMACVKHFACNSMENARFSVDIEVDEVALHETFLPQFERVVEEGVAAVMSAYNSVNGEWCGQSPALLHDVLRGEWGFEGFVISDWIFGLRDAATSLVAGLDMEMPYRMIRSQHLADALGDQRASWDDVDAAVRRVVATRLRFHDVLDAAPPGPDVLGCDEHRSLAREVAARSVVLLRNEPVDGTPILPLAQGVELAVIGALAGEVNLGDGGSSDVWDLECRTVADGLRQATIDFTADDGSDLERARRVAAAADVALVVVGYTHLDEGEFIGATDPSLAALFPPADDPAEAEAFQEKVATVPRPIKPDHVARRPQGFSQGGDRTSLRLADRDVALVRAVAEANPRTVVAIQAGSAVVCSEWIDEVPALVQAWYGGCEAGPGLTDVLLGHSNPSARLPFSVPVAETDLPPFDRDAESFRYDRWHGWWHLARAGSAPQFPFGFGLGYTTFAVDGVEAVASASGTIQVSGVVHNTGSRDGRDVVQVYSVMPDPDSPDRLVGFAAVDVPAGGSAPFEVQVAPRRLARRDPGAHAWRAPTGRHRIIVGRHAGDPEATGHDIDVG